MTIIGEVTAAYRGSDGSVTVALYERLSAAGDLGTVALNLFRACKTSERAKGYRRGRYVRASYDRKDWSLFVLTEALLRMPVAPFAWGWAIDEAAKAKQSPHHHVLYLDLPTGQVSFHSSTRHPGPDYAGEWDRRIGSAPRRVCAFCAQILGEPLDTAAMEELAAPAPQADSEPRRQEQLL